MKAAEDPQHLYARWLERGSRLVFAFAVISLALYLSGLLVPLVPLHALAALWTLPADELLRRTGAPGGWEWVRYLGYGDYLNVLAIALFSLLSLVCVARVVPAFLKRGERVQALLAVLQVIVLLAAAAY
jgi:hypothetical protein